MNTSLYMDKQIMDLASQGSSAQSKDFIDLMKHPEEDHQDHAGSGGRNGSIDEADGLRPEEIVPSYDFQPIRPIAAATMSSSQSFSYDGVSAARAWSSDDGKANSSAPIRNYSSLDTFGSAKVIPEKDQHAFDASSLVSDIDRTMKKHTDDVLHALEVLSARVTQLESRTRNLENSIDDLKVSIGNNYSTTDGKLRQFENILREVQHGVQVLKDKQEILEGNLQLTKLQVSKPDQPQETHKPTHVDSIQPPASIPQQPLQHLQPPPPSQVPFQQSVLTLPAPVTPTPSQPVLPPPAQIPNQFPQAQIPPAPQRESYFPPPGQTQEVPNQQPYQLPPGQQPAVPPPAAPPHQQYPPPQLPQYSQPMHPPVNPPQLQPSGQHQEEPPYLPSHSQAYPPMAHRQPPAQLPSGPPPPPPSQQLYGAPTHMYDTPPGRSSSGFSSGYGHTSGVSEQYPYGGPPPSQYGGSSPRKSQPQHSQSGGSGYPQLPTARILPQALPTASGISSGTGSGGTGNRVPIDDVVDKVTTMGFPRDQVRATVRKLTENGQPVDLNIVLDKLMNDSDVQPPRGWFGR